MDRFSLLVDRLREWFRTPGASRWILAAIIVLGAVFRLTHLNWDQGTHIHPDERFLTMVTSALDLPQSLGQFFDSTRSPMSPYNKGFGFFVYGTLPIFLVRIAGELVNKVNLAVEVWEVMPGIPLDMTGYDGIHLVGRAVSGLFDVASIFMAYVVARRLFGRRVGLLAAALYAFSPLALQQSHFYTVDTVGTFFALLTFYFAVRVAQGGEAAWRGGGWGTHVALGASLGASLACRINLAPLAGIAVLAACIRAWDDWSSARGIAGERASATGTERAWLGTLLQATLFRLLLMGLVAVAVFRVAQPYAFGGTSLLDFSFADMWRDNMRSISQIISGDADQPPMHQWANRTPFVFPWVNMVVWGMGLPMGLAAWAGWGAGVWRVIRGLTVRTDPQAVRALLLPVTWVGGMFLYHSIQFSYSMRYYLPIYPFLAMLAAWLLWGLVDRVRARQAVPESSARGRWPRLPASTALHAAYGLVALVAVATLLWGWAFLAIYRRPLTRIDASRWIYANVPPGSVVANEHWDDPLPFSLDGKMSFKPTGYYYGLTQYDRPVLDPKSGAQVVDAGTGQPLFYREGQIENYAEDTPEKRERLYQWLNDADVIVLSSNRLWGSIPRLPMRFPMTTLYYKLLMEERLGFELAARFVSFPTLFGIEFDDTKAEEAFSVYDHPEVRIYRKTAEFSEELVRSFLDEVDLENTLQMWPRQVTQAPTALLMTEEEAARQQTGGTWTTIFDEDGLLNRSPLAAVVGWLLLIEALGLLAFPLAFVALRGLADRGYGVSKTLGILALAWLSWIGPALKIVPYARWWIALGLGLLLGVSAALAWRRRAALADFLRTRRALLLSEEAVFLALFALMLLIRIANPDLWHPDRGGEKPMELAYLNAVIRSTTFPPYDPWHAGGFISYYYFGFVVAGTLVKLSGIVPWVAYNLVIPTLFALSGVGAFAVASNMADRDHATRFPGEEEPYHGLRIGSLLAGLAGTFFVAIIGNLGNVKLIYEQLAARGLGSLADGGPTLLGALKGLVSVVSGGGRLSFPNDWWFWNASRVIPDTINEFPFFSYLFADLHAHAIALPLTLLALSVAVGLACRAGDQPTRRGPWHIGLSELLPLLLLGWVLGALRATNTWDFPTFALVALAALVVLRWGQFGRAAAELPGNAPAAPTSLQNRLILLFRGVVSVAWRGAILFGAATVAFYPFTKYYATAYAGLEFWKDRKTSVSDYLVVWGFFLALALIYLLAEAAVQRREDRTPAWLRSSLPFILALGLALLVGAWVMKVHVWLIALPLLVLAGALALGRDLPPARRLGLFLLALALAITMGVEVVRQRSDLGRMNTVFKFYIQAWTLFAVSTACGLAAWAPRALAWRPGLRRLAWGVVAVLFVGCMLYPPLAARARVRDRFSAEASPRGLDGMAYMDSAVRVENNRTFRLADDKAAMLWLLRNAEGSPVILEAQVPEYRWGSRFSVYTGLPTVQGWNWHQRQQRSVVPGTDVERRVRQVEEIYNTLDLPRAQKLLEQFGVAYVIVGELERAYYSPEGLAKFELLVERGYLRVVYSGGSVTIYQVAGRGEPVEPITPTGIGPRPVPTPTPADSAASPLPTAAMLESPP